MNDFCLFTARSTGTHFLFEFIEHFGYRRKPYDSGKHYLFFHSDEAEEHRPWELADTAIITLRHPFLSYQTYMGIYHAIADDAHKWFIRNWTTLIESEPKFNNRVFVDLETDDRRGTMQRVADVIGESGPFVNEYADRWQPLNSRQRPEMDYDFSEIEQFVPWFEEKRCPQH